MQMSRFIKNESKADSESLDSDIESSDSVLESEKIGVKVYNELMTKLEKSGSD